MSENFNVPKISVYEKRVDINQEVTWANLLGGATITNQEYPSNGLANISSLSFTTNPPGQTNILDRMIVLNVQGSLTFTGGSVGGTDLMIQRGRDAPRSYPLQSVMDSITLKINGFPITIESRYFIHLLERIRTSFEQDRNFNSLWPNAVDTYGQYSDGDGANNNPLGDYFNMTNNGIVPRGGYNYYISSNTNSGAVVNFSFFEPIVLPPLIHDLQYQSKGFALLDTLDWNFNFTSQVARMWSRSQANTVPVASVVTKFDNAYLHLTWITPRLVMPIPPMLKYPYFQLSKYLSTNSAVLPAFPQVSPFTPTTTTFTSQVLQFNTIPKRIYIYAKLSQQVIDTATVQQAMMYSDSFCTIQSINIDFDNVSGILSGAKQDQLYRMSVDNGVKLSWQEFGGITWKRAQAIGPDFQIPISTVGSVIAIEIGKDLGLNSSETEGMLSKKNFQVQATYFNSTPVDMSSTDLVVQVVYDGVMEIERNSCRAYLGVVTSRDLLEAPVSHINQHELERLYGGDFYSTFKNIPHKIYKEAKNIYHDVEPYVSDINQYAKKYKVPSRALDLAASFTPAPFSGALKTGAEVADVLGYGRRKRRSKGGVLLGGCCGDDNNEDNYGYGEGRMSSNMMSRRLKKYR